MSTRRDGTNGARAALPGASDAPSARPDSASPAPAATALPPVVRLVDVHHRYGDTHAADALTLDLPAGCMVGFIGPDGVGKSTWLGLVAGARRIQRGTVEVLGGDMADARHRARVCPRIDRKSTRLNSSHRL